MKKTALFLTGLMGSGKSTVGRVLAGRLGWNFFDTDSLVEKKARLKVSKIFVRLGESRFRSMETAALRKALGSAASPTKPVVIATGGGLPVLAVNRSLMRKAGLRVYLRVPLTRLFKRLKGQGLKKRPLLTAGGFAALQRLARQREAVYASAEIRVRADQDPERVADRILRQIQKKKPGFFPSK